MGDPNWIPELSLSWNRRITSSGYVEIACEGFYYYEHRLVWESRHGALLPGQNIHHRNGDRADNRIENLEVWDTSQPAGQRAADKLAYAMEMIRRYGAPALLVDMGITSAV